MKASRTLRTEATERAQLVPPGSVEDVELSIVIVTYNVRELLRDCLTSILESIGAFRYNIWVVDNNSGDGTVEMIGQSFPQVGLIASPRNGGFAYGCNLGLERSRSKYVLLLNPDTHLPPDALWQMLSYMDSHPDAAVAGPKLVRGDGSLDLACRRSFPSPSVALFRILGLSKLLPKSSLFARYNLTYLDPDQPAEIDSVCGAFMMVRASVLSEVGPLDERFFMYGEDLDWALRIKAAGWKVLYNPAVQVLHYKGESSRQRKEESAREFYQAMELFYRKHYWPRYPWLLNWLVVAAIHLRTLIALLGYKMSRPGKQDSVKG